MEHFTVKQYLIKVYELLYECIRRISLRTVYCLRIMNYKKTIQYIKKHHCSIARYGDGEFKLMLDKEDLGFQSRDKRLAEKLKETFSSKDEKLLLCIPRCMNTLSGLNDMARNHWFNWGRREDNHRNTVKMIWQYTGKRYRFGDAQITRPYMDWASNRRAKETFPLLKSLWDDRDILIVEGEQTRLGVGNDLFDNARSTKRILAPAIGAFDRYDDIVQAVSNQYHGELILLALGPTATVLAADLAERNMQALDIGHIDIEYEWYLRGTKEKMVIPGKFVNEITEGRLVDDCSDETYLLSVVMRIF